MAPTLWWVCQRWEGMHGVHVTVQGQVHERIEGLHDGHSNSLRLFGPRVSCLYHISPG